MAVAKVASTQGQGWSCRQVRVGVTRALPAQEQASRLHLQTREVAAWFHQGLPAQGTTCGGVQLEGKSGHETCMGWQPSCPKGPGHRWSAWGVCEWRQCMTDPRSVGCGPVLQVHHLLPRHHMCWSCAGSPVGETPGRVACATNDTWDHSGVSSAHVWICTIDGGQ